MSASSQLAYAPMPAGKRVALPDLLIQNRNFVLLWAAYGISAVGDHLSEMALFQTAGGFARDDSMRVQALMTFCFFLPFVVLGPLAGWWADRFSRKWSMIACDLIRCVIMGSLPLTLPWLLELRLGDFAIALPLAVAGVFAAFFSPARQAMVPTLIRDDQLVRANAMISALGTIGAILSAILGGMLVDLSKAGRIHVDWNYRLDAVSFILSAVLLAGVAMSRSRVVPHEVTGGVWTPLREGFAYVRDHRRVLQMILLGTVFWAAAGIVISVIPAIVRDIFGGAYTEAGAYRGLVAAGLAVGAALLTLVGPALPIPLGVLIALVGGGLWVWALDAALLFKLGRIFSGVCLFMIGVHGAGILVNIMVIIQRFVPDARRGRVFGVADMCTMAAITVATGLIGVPHIEHLDRHIPWLLGVTGAGLLLSMAFAWRTYRHGDAVPARIWLAWRLVRFHAAFWCRARRIGPCTVPRWGPVLVVASDASVGPIAIAGTCIHRLVGFVGMPGYGGGGLSGLLMRLMNGWACDAADSDEALRADGLRMLESGGCVGLCVPRRDGPHDQRERGARHGLGAMALQSDAMVIPCHIAGVSSAAARPHSRRLRHVRVRYGKPIDLSVWRGREQDGTAAQDAGELILKKIEELGTGAERDAS